MQKDSFQFITDNYRRLTKNEQVVADYIMLNFSEAIEMTVSEISKKCGVGAATPIRLAKRMGFEGYTAFRLHLAKCAPKREDDYFDMDKELLGGRDAVEKLLKSEIESIRLTMEQIDHSVLKGICRRISSADSILFFGSGTSYLAATDAAYKFLRVGKTVVYTDSAEHAAVMMSSFSKNSLVIVISHSGEHRGGCSTLSLAKSLGLTTCVFTAFEGSRAYNMADLVVKTEARESPLHKIAFTSRISQLCAVDALFMTYYSEYSEACSEKLSFVAENVDKVKKQDVK